MKGNGMDQKEERKTLTLPVEGMTCASCVARVEKAIARIDGIEDLSVNLATDQVTFTFDPGRVDLETVADAVKDAGYTLHLPEKGGRDRKAVIDEMHRESYEKLRRDFIMSVSLTLFVMPAGMLTMFPAIRDQLPISLESLDKLLFIATTLIMLGPGKRFFTGAVKAFLHRSADMNTLVAVGTGSAYLYSTIVVLFPQALGFTSHTHVYFDTAAAIITLILLGKLLEARAKSRTTEAIPCFWI